MKIKLKNFIIVLLSIAPFTVFSQSIESKKCKEIHYLDVKSQDYIKRIINYKYRYGKMTARAETKHQCIVGKQVVDCPECSEKKVCYNDLPECGQFQLYNVTITIAGTSCICSKWGKPGLNVKDIDVAGFFMHEKSGPFFNCEPSHAN